MAYRELFPSRHVFLLIPILAIFLSAGSVRASGSEECGTTAYPSNTGYATPDPITLSSDVWSFVSEPNLHPMKISVNINDMGSSSGKIFVAPYSSSATSSYGQQGALMIENSGNPIWFRPLSSANLMNTDFRVQKLAGEPVLTFWQGTLAAPPAHTDVPSGSSEPGSCYYILDKSYQVIKTVSAQKGYTADVHEFLITPNNTALFLSTRAVPMDLTPYGGPKDGSVEDFAIQEVDLRTNELLFFWDALSHIPLAESYESASDISSSGNIWDPYHLNSIGLTDNPENILVSGRSTSSVYMINKPRKEIVWRLGGKKSDFKIDAGGEFAWQHDARFLPNNVISMFDDHCCESNTVPAGTPPSHGLFLKLDLEKKTARPQAKYYYSPNLNSSSQGNAQILPDGNVLIGWGATYFSEYAAGGGILYAAQMPGSSFTYRAYRENWVGMPHYPPSIAVQSSDGTTTLYASWNGSTETKSWQVFSGNDADKLAPVKSAAKTGFETAIPLTDGGSYFQIKAIDAKGQVIGVSKIVTVTK
jgi:hypothetical protein